MTMDTLLDKVSAEMRSETTAATTASSSKVHGRLTGEEFGSAPPSMMRPHRPQGARRPEVVKCRRLKASFTEPSAHQPEPSHQEGPRRTRGPMTKAEILVWQARNGRIRPFPQPTEKGIDRSAGPTPPPSKRLEAVGPVDGVSSKAYWSREKNVGSSFGSDSDSEGL
jgi:hypothetical protein